VKEFEHILNWRLLHGTHAFPGRDGGTCINEAAIVAAGFKYRSVVGVGDMPPCFSPVIAEFALSLNDEMPDDQRQRLLPFVTRLAGTADEPGVELRRDEYLALEACRRFLSRALDAAGLPDHASRCRAVRTLNGAQSVAAMAARAAWGGGDAAAWDDAIAMLEGVLAIGRQAEPLDAVLVAERLERAKEAARV
jgi:hypothetical protein